MSEKRFTYDNPIGFGKGEIIDNQTTIHYEATISVLLQLLNGFDDVLNEQQSTISKLKEELELTGNTKLFSRRELKMKVKEQAETIRKQSIRIYCQDKEVQRLLGELEKIPKNIREVWLE